MSRDRMGCGGLALTWGTGAFLIGGTIWSLVTGREPRVELILAWGSYCLLVVICMLDFFFYSWREESKEMAKRLKNIERTVEAIQGIDLKEILAELNEKLDEIQEKLDE